MGMETGIWAMYGIKQPKRQEILSQTTISSTHNVTMRLKRELNSDEWNEVYMLILESLVVNYVEVRGWVNLTWSNSPVSPVKIETTYKHEMPSTAENITSSDNRKLPLRRNEIIHTDVAIKHAMEWMEAPKQLEESSETYRRRQVAAQRVRETPLRGDAASEASESISHISSLYPPPQRIPLLDEWKDQVSYQRLREDDMRQDGESRIDDRGVRFNGHQPIGHKQCHFVAVASGDPDDGDNDGKSERGPNGPHQPEPPRPPQRNGGGDR
jgi:hypothetical protein